MPETGPLGPAYPKTAAQANIWLAQQIAPENPIYKIAWYTEIREHIDVERTEFLHSAKPLLTSVAAAFHAGVDDASSTASALAFAQWLRRRGQDKQRAVLVDLEGHDRREQLVGAVDLSRTVDWSTNILPARLDVIGIDLNEALAGGRAAGQALEKSKNSSASRPTTVWVSTYCTTSTSQITTILVELPAQIIISYLGRLTVSGTGDWVMVPDWGRGGGAQDQSMSYSPNINVWTEDLPTRMWRWSQSARKTSTS